MRGESLVCCECPIFLLLSTTHASSICLHHWLDSFVYQSRELSMICQHYRNLLLYKLLISMFQVVESSQAAVISLSESPKGPFLVLCFLHSIPLHSVAWFRGMLSLIISMLTIASCIFPFHQATLLQHWMVYNHAWPLSSPGCRQINWNWTQIKLNSSSLGMNGNRADIFLFPIELLGVKTYPA